VFPVLGDDRFCTISVWNDEQWTALCVMAAKGWESDPRWTTTAGRKAFEDDLEAAVATWTSTQGGSELVTALQHARVPSAVVLDVRDLLHDEQLAHREHFVVREHPEIGPHTYNGASFRMSRSRPAVAPGPCLGADTDTVLVGWLGMSPADVDALRASGAITAREGDLRQAF
jgi:crotonobetainyl-CoA:carnitine CoA-transferase CaiB-like acyl-CoA transferase